MVRLSQPRQEKQLLNTASGGFAEEEEDVAEDGAAANDTETPDDEGEVWEVDTFPADMIEDLVHREVYDVQAECQPAEWYKRFPG